MFLPLVNKRCLVRAGIIVIVFSCSSDVALRPHRLALRPTSLT